MTATDSSSRLAAGRPGADPTGLTLIRDFINTKSIGGPDDLSDATALERWLLSQRLVKARGKTTQGDLRHAVEVREALRDLAGANAGATVPKEAAETLSRAARSAQLGLRFGSDGGAQLEPAASGVDAALGEMLAIAFRAILDGSWPRLKTCRDETCRWAFYDHSKNRSGSWCSMAVCGNRTKARKFRRQAHAAAKG